MAGEIDEVLLSPEANDLMLLSVFSIFLVPGP